MTRHENWLLRREGPGAASVRPVAIIHPVGFICGYLGGVEINAAGLIVIPRARAAVLNTILNLTDFVIRIAFGVVIWAAATSSDASQPAAAQKA